jgi:hypothetical protein
MNTTITNKLAALGLALMVNSVIMGGVAYLFSDRQYAPAAVSVIAAPSAGLQSIA